MFKFFSRKKSQNDSLLYKSNSVTCPRPIVQALCDILESTTMNDWASDFDELRHKESNLRIWHQGKSDVHIWQPTRVDFNKDEVKLINSSIEKMVARSLWNKIKPAQGNTDDKPLDRR